MPPDTEIVPISRTVGRDRIVDEFVFRFTHTLPMDWLLPGVPPTGRPVAVVKVVIVQFDGIAHGVRADPLGPGEGASQLGLLEPDALPVAGLETILKTLDRGLPSNALMKRTIADARL